jgi:site-specific DNA recombinase
VTLRRPRPVHESIRAAIYCRISLARFGETVKVDEQEKLCRKVAHDRGWRIVENCIFKDPNRSAWQRDRRRPGWDAMLEAIDLNQVDGIIVYHGDRLIRQPWDLELLLRLADQRGVRLASPTGERDLDNPDDRFILRIEAAQACRESDNTSRRLRWHFDKAADKGVVRLGGRGGRAFGFEPDGITHRPADVKAINEVADRILAGEPIGAIARDLNERKIFTTTGGPWDHGSLKKLMMRPRLAGLVSHHGQIVGDAAWLPILDEDRMRARERWDAVVAVLERKAAGFSYATNTGKYQLTGIAVCGSCESTVVVRHNTRGRSLLGYGCINPQCKRKVHRSIAHLDPFVDGAMVALLGDERVRQRMATPVSRDLTAELRQVESQKDALLTQAAEPALSVADAQTQAEILRVTVRGLNERIEKLRTEVASQQIPNVLDGLWDVDLGRWRALPLARRRAAITASMRVVILPSRKGPGFDPSTVRLEQLL